MQQFPHPDLPPRVIFQFLEIRIRLSNCSLVSRSIAPLLHVPSARCMHLCGKTHWVIDWSRAGGGMEGGMGLAQRELSESDLHFLPLWHVSQGSMLRWHNNEDPRSSLSGFCDICQINKLRGGGCHTTCHVKGQCRIKWSQSLISAACHL